MKKRVVIVDYNHMAHTYMNSGHRLSAEVDGQLIDTTVQSGTIKAIHRWSNHGYFPTAVCFDSPVPARKAYFAKNFDMGIDTDNAYKGGRKPMGDEMMKAVTMVKDLLVASGVSCFKGHNYEADDLIFACIERAKLDYPGVPIDVITNDADLLPLVDDTVSVFLRSKKMTWAESKDIEKAHYIQVTPNNYQEVVEDLSAYKKFLIPYNSILLQKLVRGDNSDNIKGVKSKFPPKKYNALIETLDDMGVSFDKIFRYGKCRETLVSLSTGEEVDASHDRNDLAIRYDDPQELLDMLDILCWHIDEESLIHIKKMYTGMNLNQAYPSLGSISRRPAKLKDAIKPFNEVELQSKVKRLGINLNLDVY